jgi:hypothetical protein
VCLPCVCFVDVYSQHLCMFHLCVGILSGQSSIFNSLLYLYFHARHFSTRPVASEGPYPLHYHSGSLPQTALCRYCGLLVLLLSSQLACWTYALTSFIFHSIVVARNRIYPLVSCSNAACANMPISFILGSLGHWPTGVFTC